MPFLFVGNHACLDFINTQLVVNERPVDLLDTFSHLVMWLRQAEVLNEEDAKTIDRQWSGQAKGEQTLTEARAFRATLREMVERIAAGKPVPQTAVDAINRQLRHRIGYSQLTRRKRQFERGFKAEFQDATQLLGLLAEAASDLLCTCELSLPGLCALFLRHDQEPRSSLVQHESLRQSPQGGRALSPAADEEHVTPPSAAGLSSPHLTSYAGKRSINASRVKRCSVLLC
ncbi:MAG: hypothetical protein K0S79_1118 [Nitrospira sp.]|nr:hypothetical protein [Nitrospira sp.]